jgi:gluconate 2-dehydrogenase gamma chain
MAQQGQPRDGAALERRSFLKTLGAASGAAALPIAGAAAQTGHAPMGMPMPAPAGSSTPTYLFFNLDEAAFIEAAVDTLIPSDAVGPGALESGVAVYIDRQLAGAFGNGARLYMQGPFAEGTPQQGYQFPLLPAELVRVGIADTEAWCQSSRKKSLAGLAPADRAAVMTELETGKASFAAVPAPAFFGMLLQLTMEGYFADPAYGGNKDKAVWKMLGFPGVGGMYSEDIETFRNKPYPHEPKSLKDFA